MDLSIPSLPVKVQPGAGPANPPAMTAGRGPAAPEKKLSLSALAPAMGRTAATLRPLQERGWFYWVELGPVAALFGWWLVSRRQLYLDQHPDLVRRRQARRGLRREWRNVSRAAQAGDARGFATGAVRAIRLACAPHFPAEPRALVCGDVLQQLPAADRTGENGEVVRRLFRAVDALDFAGAPGEVADLLAWQPRLDRLSPDWRRSYEYDSHPPSCFTGCMDQPVANFNVAAANRSGRRSRAGGAAVSGGDGGVSGR